MDFLVEVPDFFFADFFFVDAAGDFFFAAADCAGADFLADFFLAAEVVDFWPDEDFLPPKMPSQFSANLLVLPVCKTVILNRRV